MIKDPTAEDSDQAHGRTGHRGLLRPFTAALPRARARAGGPQTGVPHLLGRQPGRHEIEDQIAEGDKVVTRLTAHGVHRRDLPGIPATGRQVTMTATVIHRIEGGKIAEKWADKDVLGFLQQLGVLPTP